MYRFPEGLYCDIRTERRDEAVYNVHCDDQSGVRTVKNNSETTVIGAIVRVYDGKMWYTSVTDDLDSIQAEIDSLAEIAERNHDIADDPVVKMFEVNKDTVLMYEGGNDIRNTTREQREKVVTDMIEAISNDDFPEIKQSGATYFQEHYITEFFSSKGAEIKQDFQHCYLGRWFDIVVNGVKTTGGKYFSGFSFEELLGHEDEVLKERERYMDFAKNAVDVEAGDYVCVLSPKTTGMFTHESFGHKSEADFMLNDQTLRDEWVIGKKVGSSLVSICDDGFIEGERHNGDVAYDDEGTKSRPTWLIKDGVLTGRLHDAKSAATLGEELTGNSRAQDYHHAPMVRMTNTYMAAGETPPEEMIAGVKDGVYVYNVSYGTGQGTFTMKPIICYRIRDGKLCEPLRVNVVSGSVFKTLFDIDAVGNDLEFTETATCGKNGQSVRVSDSGPTIRVKSLTVN